jgi:hypothetical protein
MMFMDNKKGSLCVDTGPEKWEYDGGQGMQGICHLISAKKWKK